jgi:hypothetical protein
MGLEGIVSFLLQGLDIVEGQSEGAGDRPTDPKSPGLLVDRRAEVLPLESATRDHAEVLVRRCVRECGARPSGRRAPSRCTWASGLEHQTENTRVMREEVYVRSNGKAVPETVSPLTGLSLPGPYDSGRRRSGRKAAAMLPDLPNWPAKRLSSSRTITEPG